MNMLSGQIDEVAEHQKAQDYPLMMEQALTKFHSRDQQVTLRNKANPDKPYEIKLADLLELLNGHALSCKRLDD